MLFVFRLLNLSVLFSFYLKLFSVLFISCCFVLTCFEFVSVSFVCYYVVYLQQPLDNRTVTVSM